MAIDDLRWCAPPVVKGAPVALLEGRSGERLLVAGKPVEQGGVSVDDGEALAFEEAGELRGVAAVLQAHDEQTGPV